MGWGPKESLSYPRASDLAFFYQYVLLSLWMCLQYVVLFPLYTWSKQLKSHVDDAKKDPRSFFCSYLRLSPQLTNQWLVICTSKLSFCFKSTILKLLGLWFPLSLKITENPINCIYWHLSYHKLKLRKF